LIGRQYGLVASVSAGRISFTRLIGLEFIFPPSAFFLWC
jgi:hypothetical protein